MSLAMAETAMPPLAVTGQGERRETYHWHGRNGTTYPRNIHQFKDPSSLVEATPQPTSSPPSPRDGSIKVLAFPENRADDIQAEARALARAANATSYTPQLVASKYGSQPIKDPLVGLPTLACPASANDGSTNGGSLSSLPPTPMTVCLHLS
ncbi:Protein ACTIVITY OF BC1 COMPLEX KINASE 3, chloroplastic [Glycine max]|nr:Protein ACTIVITY OF BC1 COMPLEX KINASE 3, chloroplastic [Glycine max]